ncbi:MULTISPECIES: YMGG-like glycine zipper-containing protein [unclassified Pseudomonas]|uniref:YMGG-like glycine zipper-containing protein n=1 Tax=Pseudomonas sp. A-R-26 TaxID=2832404 RepID=UPI001CBC5B9E|nr:YMGG-like glycine zipper-containing protein [Pseudomonas sp. A-R-26]
MKILAETLAVLMVFLSTCALTILVMLLSTSAQAATVVPLKGQTSQTIQQDTSACQSQANAQHPVQSTVPSGGRVKGAATAAVAGATAAEVRGRQHENLYDQIDDDTRQDYRQNRVHSAAAAGAIVGGSRQRQERRQNLSASEQSLTANNSVYSSCLQQRGYDVLP